MVDEPERYDELTEEEQLAAMDKGFRQAEEAERIEEAPEVEREFRKSRESLAERVEGSPNTEADDAALRKAEARIGVQRRARQQRGARRARLGLPPRQYPAPDTPDRMDVPTGPSSGQNGLVPPVDAEQRRPTFDVVGAPEQIGIESSTPDAPPPEVLMPSPRPDPVPEFQGPPSRPAPEPAVDIRRSEPPTSSVPPPGAPPPERFPVHPVPPPERPQVPQDVSPPVPWSPPEPEPGKEPPLVIGRPAEPPPSLQPWTPERAQAAPESPAGPEGVPDSPTPKDIPGPPRVPERGLPRVPTVESDRPQRDKLVEMVEPGVDIGAWATPQPFDPKGMDWEGLSPPKPFDPEGMDWKETARNLPLLPPGQEPESRMVPEAAGGESPGQNGEQVMEILKKLAKDMEELKEVKETIDTVSDEVSELKVLVEDLGGFGP